MRSYFYSIIASAVLLLAAVGASAQVGQLRGHVFIQQADGTKVPAAGAQVDVYRTDLPGKFPSKANKNGEFVYAGLPYIGTYVIAVSAPNAAPAVRGGVKVGRDIDFELVMTPGNGQRLTEEQAKAGGGGGSETPASGGSGESAADRAKREEMEKKNAAVIEENKKIENANQVIGDAFRGGNTALTAKNYDEAVRQYDTGIAADAAHPGIPSLLTNKSVALRLRGVDRFNAAVQSKDEAAKTSGMEAAKADFKASADAASQAVDTLKKLPTPTDPAELKQFETNKYFALTARAESMRLFTTKVDPTKADAAVVAYQEYIAAEPDAVKKGKAQKDFAQMLFETATDTASYERVVAEYQKHLEGNPDDAVALLRIGQAMFNIGALNNNDKAKYQEAANYLQRYVDKAPDTDPMKAEAKDLIGALKAQANVTPERTTRPPRRRP
ncbi:MAG TPA: carboxypeptidase-like regulatory domain-containing protein [Pyrinomonadaceae bacterium]|nr:carboxypeptidase-like regulatory domain-containing protein [Pyrinomonadaceae bacterium]